MEAKNNKLIFPILAILIILVVGFFWARQAQGPSGTSGEFTPTVDRGFISPEDEEIALNNIRIIEERIAESEKRDLTLLLQAGNAYYTYGDLAKAIEYYDDILSTNPGDAPALENKGQALYDGGDYKGAAEAWSTAILSDPNPLTYIRLASLYSNELPEHKARAQVLLEEAIATNGQEHDLVYALGNWYEMEGMLEEAISHYEIALKLEPENQDLRETVANLRAELTKQMQENRN